MIHVLFYLIPAIVLLYIALIVFYLRNWNKTRGISIASNKPNLPFVSVIIVGRNEADNIKTCLESISNNLFPKEKYEIIYIDDHSTDDSPEILKSLDIENLTFYELKDFIDGNPINNYKKTAIKYAISIAKGEIILQTDADTVVGKKWIASHLSSYLNSEINFATAPILYKVNDNCLEQFQKYDILVTAGVTAAGINSGLHYMANGANMSFRKKVYLEHNTDNPFASGDDMFLVQNIANKNKKSVSFIKEKEAVVYTYPETTLKSFVAQRLRWATKTSSYKDPGLKATVLLVFFTNVFILVSPFLYLFFAKLRLLIALMVLLKFIIDVIFTKSIAGFFSTETKLKFLVLTFVSYPLYIIFIGIKSLFFKQYQWKDRMVK